MAKKRSNFYQCKAKCLTGHRYTDIMPLARVLFRELKRKTKRRPYVRSAYFEKDKIFFDFFWHHLNTMLPSERAKRLRFFPCALELLQKSRNNPITFIDVQRPDVIKHMFQGKTADGYCFAVVIQQERKTGKKQLLTLYPLHALK